MSDEVTGVMADKLEAKLKQPAPKQPLIDTPAKGVAEVLFDIGGLLRSDKLNGPIDPVQPPGRSISIRSSTSQSFWSPACCRTASISIPRSTSIARSRPTRPIAGAPQLAIADNLRDLEKTDDALKQLQDLVAAEPKRSEAAVALGDLYRKEKRFGEAAAAYTTGDRSHRQAAAERLGRLLFPRHGL